MRIIDLEVELAKQWPDLSVRVLVDGREHEIRDIEQDGNIVYIKTEPVQ